MTCFSVRNSHPWLRAFCLVLAFILCACGTKHYKWSEDVALDDGRTITVNRTVTFKETTPVSGGTYVAEETDATIEFTGELAQLPMWRQPLMALELYQDSANSEWVVVTSTTSCDVWRRRKKAKPPYWEFRLRNGVWQEAHLSEASIGRKSNLLSERHIKLDHYAWSDKVRLLYDPQIGRGYREIWGDPEQYTCGEGNTNKT